jgi:predicted nucleotidyltransferase
MERILSELIEKLQKAHQERLVSVVLYGSAVNGESRDRYSDFNVLCVLKQITPAELADSEPVFRWWREMKNPAPLLLSEDEVHTSSDCFPIEFHDIKERHSILFGADLISNIEVDYTFYRAQVEHDLRAKLLRLRQKAGGVLSQKDLLLKLMADSVSTFCVLFRHALLLCGSEAQFEKRAVIAAAAEKFGIDPGPFNTLLDVRDEKVKTSSLQPGPLFREYLKQVQVVVDAVDRMEK